MPTRILKILLFLVLTNISTIADSIPDSLLRNITNMKATQAPSGRYFVSGIVRDSLTREPIPMAAVSTDNRRSGTLANSTGIFEMTVPNNTKSLVFSSQGYASKVLPIRKNRVNIYEVLLAPQAQMLDEVVIKRNKYSKKNNPAVQLMERIRATANANDPHRNPYYNYNKYERITLGLNNITADKDGKQNKIMQKFPFLWEYVDTSEISGKPVLPLSVRETSSEVHYRQSPKAEREVITGLKSSGVDEIANQENMRMFMQDVLREIDIYDHDINLLHSRFVSPLSPVAADFYKFYITDSVTIDNEKTLELSFYPHNKAVLGFVGRMYVVPSDTAMFIRRVNMRIAPEINLNFIENMYVDQEFERAADGSRIKTRDDLIMEISVIPGMQGMYARRNIAYSDANFDKPANDSAVFQGLANTIITPEARLRNEDFWRSVRLFEIPHGEASVGNMLAQLRSNKLYYWGEKFIKIMASGYVYTAKDSKFDIGPLNTFVTGNTLEGLRLRLGGMTTANLSKHWFGRFYVAHGFRDHKWKYGTELEYAFNEKKYHSREFPVHSLRFNSSYDIDQIGQSYLFTNPDNFILALKRQADNRVSYRRLNQLAYTLELENNFSVTATAANDRQFSSRVLQFTTTTPNAELPINAFTETWGEITLRYAPGEKFYQTRTYRLPINLDAWTVSLSHRFATRSLASKWSVNRTEASIMHRFWFSAWGYLDLFAKGGHVWSSKTPYTQMFIPNANLSYTVQPESFCLINAMEFVADSYASADLSYFANGAILNYIPLIKKLKLREVLSARSFWGKLSHRNDPRCNSNMLMFPANDIAVTDVSRTPYIEVGVGLENILKCLRVDYVWRLTHRHPGYPVDKSGIRIAMHFAF